MKTYEFIGKPSGDGESFCWEVDVETFKKVTGEEPEGWDYVSCEHKWDKDGNIEFYNLSELVKLYPDDIFSKNESFERYNQLKIKIEYEEI
jgi:hypothetical protein